MSEKGEEQFQWTNIWWICEKIIDDDDEEKVRNYCHVTGKKVAAHWSCNR